MATAVFGVLVLVLGVAAMFFALMAMFSADNPDEEQQDDAG